MKPVLRRPNGGTPPIPIAIDSGAHALASAYTPLIASKRSLSYKRPAGKRAAEGFDFSFLDSPEFDQYLQKYAEFVTQYGNWLTYSVALDIMGDAEASWVLYREMKDRGLNVMPVYHFGEDPKWLKKYMDETDYVGLGGLQMHGSREASQDFQRRTWKLLCDDKGKPLLKVHGFGMTAMRPLETQPFYSVDSSRAFTIARYGGILVPERIGKEFRFSSKPRVVTVSRQSAKSANNDRHIGHEHPDGLKRKAVEEYLDTIGLTLEDVTEEGGWRDMVNLYYMNAMMQGITQRRAVALGVDMPTIYYTSGCFFSSSAAGFALFAKGIKKLSALGHTNYLAYLGTFWAPYPLRLIYEHWTGKPMPVSTMKWLPAASQPLTQS